MKNPHEQSCSWGFFIIVLLLFLIGSQLDVLQRELSRLFVNLLVCLVVNDGAVFYRDVFHAV